MPYKDPQKAAQYQHDYWREHKEKRQAYFKHYREENREEIAENKRREMRLTLSHSEHLYLGVSGMTRKQRQKFQKELNGETV